MNLSPNRPQRHGDVAAPQVQTERQDELTIGPEDDAFLTALGGDVTREGVAPARPLSVQEVAATAVWWKR